jgi:hypothetical protein
MSLTRRELAWILMHRLPPDVINTIVHRTIVALYTPLLIHITQHPTLIAAPTRGTTRDILRILHKKYNIPSSHIRLTGSQLINDNTPITSLHPYMRMYLAPRITESRAHRPSPPRQWPALTL